MRRFLIFLAVVAMVGVPLFLFLGRAPTIHTKPLSRKNPTSYVFRASIEDTRAAMNKAFDRGAWKGMVLSLIVDPTEEGYCLDKSHDPIGKSSLYRVRGEPADYLARFMVPLVKRSSQATEVKIRTQDSEVIAGKKFGFGSCGPGFANRYVPVEPTTIEEYEILLRIGVELGEKGMPALVLP